MATILELDTSMRVRIYDVVIPAELDESELAGYLADIFHDNAKSIHLIVEKLI